ncbi:MAG: hypothetical protein HYU77_11660 [Betaproteobacteria bacterium]|nr:hypothetical protein [Betaproteobacteria bacterium]
MVRREFARRKLQMIGDDRACAAGTNFTIAERALNGVAVTVTCSSTAHGAPAVYYLTSKATIGGLGSPAYAERRMEATVSNIP